MEKMILSIIIPVYNVQKYLKRCLDSVVNKSIDEVEILLIDDGSTDTSPAICNDYAKKYDNIRVIHQKNGGLSAARNTGICNAAGKYLAFLDSDDMFDREFIKDILTYIKFQHADMFSFGFCPEHNNNYKCIGDKKIKIYNRYDYIEKIIDNTFSCQVCFRVFKKKLFNDSLFTVNCYYEDIRILWKLVLLSEKIVHINYSYYIYNFSNQNSITKLINVDSMKDMKDSVDIMTKGIFNKYKTEGLLNEKIKEKISYYKLNEYIYIAYKLRYLKKDETGIKKSLVNYIKNQKINLVKYKKYNWKKYLLYKFMIKIGSI